MRKPNVILILADDLGYGDLGVFGNSVIRTPNIDRMAAEGARLTTFYASANVCTPSRAGLLTGRYPIRTGLARDVIRQNDTNGLPLSEITIAEALKPDYATALVGKWHLGHVAPFWPPTQHGFDLFSGLPYSHDMKPIAYYAAGPGVELTEEPMAMDRLTEKFFARGLDFVDANKDKPFFLLLTLTAPHIPLDPHPDHAGKSAAAEYGDVVEEIAGGEDRVISENGIIGGERGRSGVHVGRPVVGEGLADDVLTERRFNDLVEVTPLLGGEPTQFLLDVLVHEKVHGGSLRTGNENGSVTRNTHDLRVGRAAWFPGPGSTARPS
jgi:uncharacterized sulfatase